MLNCILPGRIGEIARPVILQKRDRIPFSTGLATVVAERIFDVGLLILFFSVLLATVNIDPDIVIPFGKYHLNRETLVIIGRGMVKLCIVRIAGIIMVSIERVRKVIIGIIFRIPSLFFFVDPSFKDKIKMKMCAPLVKIVINFASGLALVKQPKKMCICIGLSIVIWVLAAFSYFIVAFGAPGIELSFTEIFAMMIIICFFIVLPSVPGFWGLWEAGGVFALSLFGVSLKDAAGYTLVNHAIQLFPVIIIGLVSASITGINIWQVGYDNK